MNTGKIFLVAAALLFFTATMSFGQNWQMQAVKLQTRWAKEVSPANALKEYPRPQMTRPDWTNLNGLWDYALTKKDAPTPAQYDGQILVPFPIESALSGVKKALMPGQNLWYKRSFQKPGLKTGERLLLHFGAVDWQTTVYVNGQEVGTHTGGYTAFTMDITYKLKDGSNDLVIKVYDPTDQGIGPSGKQTLDPQNIYYTATSGIWQTVWLEAVPATHIESLTITPDIDQSLVNITVNATAGEAVSLTVEGKTITGKSNTIIPVAIAHEKLWSPADPHLYSFTAKLGTDEVGSYFGMRKISVAKDAQGVDRICLNNQPYYNLGVLDQGFWPDGLYTAPTDEALAFDIKAIKAMGFNTIRKHIKVEPARWYYHADQLGMLVWQDMVNPNQGLPEGAKPEFERESAEILQQLHNYPCITTWVLFNEKWGQYDQKRLTEWIKQTDPSRIVDGHTGELLYVNEQLRSPSPDAYVSADMTDVHSYPDPMMPVKQAGKAQVVGEFGGIGVAIAGHEWNEIKGWGYIQVAPDQLEGKYHIMVEDLKTLEAQGLSGSIYTQPFDVEGEENGLMTYDREIIKIPFEDIRKINSLLVPDMGTIPEVTAQNSDKTDEGERYANLLDQYRTGKLDPGQLKDLAMMALRVNDKPGGTRIAGSYIQTLKAPFTEDNIRFIAQFTKSTTDPGFQLINNNPEPFKKVLGERQFTVNMMNMIFTGDINPMLEGNDHPDWPAIKSKIDKYGAPGEEIFLRAETVAYINQQDWAHYVPVATDYLGKYGSNLSPEEKTMFQNAIDQHK